ncbi:MAG: hypothetical protein KJ060_02630 [Candidatus Hydrogenedentes bacterium]|nr:hypothetical protein [Candidatus Hydrogenedentota bacterium]
MSNPKLKHAVIDAYREELRDRYRLDNVRRFGVLDQIPDKIIDDLREFLLEYVYPGSEERDKLDDAFDRMREITRSPRRMAPLMKSAFKTVWKLGMGFPSAMATASHALEACLEARKFETRMIDFAEREGIAVEDLAERGAVVRVFTSISDSEVAQVREEVLKVIGAMSDVNLLAAAVTIMENVREIADSRPDLYGDRERAGFSMGHEILRRGLELSRQLKPSDIPVIIEGIAVVEIDWYDRIKMEAAR